MTPVRPDDLEALETVSQNVEARDLFLRMAHLSGAGELNRFLFELSESDEIDAETKAVFAEVAQDRELGSAREEAAARAEANVLRLPVNPRPRPVTDMQRGLDMCG